jgi:hypothetical protein
MAFVSANNKIYKAKASAMLLQAQKLRQQAAYLRASIEIEQTRRQRLVVDLEISTSDDEEVVTAWHRPDNESRRKSTQRDKGKQRAVDVEELATDEEDFSSPFVSYVISLASAPTSDIHLSADSQMTAMRLH